MSDLRRRTLERAGRGGDVEAAARALHERVRSGGLRLDRLLLAAHCGDPGATLAVSLRQPAPAPDAAEAELACALEAIGPHPASPGVALGDRPALDTVAGGGGARSTFGSLRSPSRSIAVARWHSPPRPEDLRCVRRAAPRDPTALLRLVGPLARAHGADGSEARAAAQSCAALLLGRWVDGLLTFGPGAVRRAAAALARASDPPVSPAVQAVVHAALGDVATRALVRPCTDLADPSVTPPPDGPDLSEALGRSHDAPLEEAVSLLATDPTGALRGLLERWRWGPFAALDAVSVALVPWALA